MIMAKLIAGRIFSWFIGTQIGRMAGLAIIVTIIFFALIERAERRGAEEAIDKVEEENAEAISAADAAALGFAECMRTDGVFWDFGTSECVRSE